jgi:hypothetical protein
MPFFQNGSQFGIYVYIGESIFLKRKELNNKGDFKCSICSRISTISFFGVIFNPSEQCLKCGYISLIAGMRYGSLEYTGQDCDIPKSTKVSFKCDCGKSKNIVLSTVIRGNSRSCGLCNTINLYDGFSIGQLTYTDPPILTHPKSNKKIHLKCSCGNSITRSVKVFLSGSNSSDCGSCSKIILNPGDPYGNFYYAGTSSIEVYPTSKQKLSVACRCGTISIKAIADLTRGSKSCGVCYEKVLGWYSSNLNSIKSSNNPTQLPNGGPIFISNFFNASSPFNAKCPACGNTYKPRLRDIKQGRSLTCGCSNYNISSYNIEISRFLSSYDVYNEVEYSIDGFKFDICVPSNRLLIEVSGLYWHSFPDSKRKDLHKRNIAIRNGLDLIMIYEDEWIRKQDQFKTIILNRLNQSSCFSVRPSDCCIKKVGYKEADLFLEENHYIGACKAPINYIVLYENKIVACASFKRPTRQSSHEWELARMARHKSYNIHGIWSKILNNFILEYAPTSIVSFSDDRLFTGRVYSKMGFIFSGKIHPDYYWVMDTYRYHKSGLRKKGREKLLDLTESDLRMNEGYRKIWDLGKSRWIWSKRNI